MNKREVYFTHPSSDPKDVAMRLQKQLDDVWLDHPDGSVCLEKCETGNHAYYFIIIARFPDPDGVDCEPCEEDE